MTYQEIHNFLTTEASLNPKKNAVFYKTGPGQYAEHDRFLGIDSAAIHFCAQRFEKIREADLQRLIESPFNEERAIALQIAILRYQRGNATEKEQIFRWYMEHLKQVNNWNLVDASAHYIIGAHVYGTKTRLRFQLARSEVMWERRIAIVSTLYDIRLGTFEPTCSISRILLTDAHDLIHKAVGWMLREVGKKDKKTLCDFLGRHVHSMPRTMLRYAIERFPELERRGYLEKPR